MTMKPKTPGNGAHEDTSKPMAANDSAAPVDLETSEDSSGTAETPDPIAQLETEKIDLKEKLLRTLADMENLRRRTEREIADSRAYAVTNFARDMLTVADNTRRALDSVPEDARGEGNGALNAFIEGIELTERDLLKTLERHGVKRLDPQGQKFDPHLHQAMFEVPNPDLPNGTVVQVMQTGYVIGDRVLRPALVGVAKGGPRAALQDAAPNQNGAPAAAGGGEA